MGTAVKLGNHTIGLRKRVPQVDGGGNPIKDDYGDPVVTLVDVKVRWCLMTPSTWRTAGNDEPEDRAAPRITGMTLLAPPSTALDAADVVIWPITAEAIVNGTLTLSGPVWQVEGDVGSWAETGEAQLRKAT